MLAYLRAKRKTKPKKIVKEDVQAGVKSRMVGFFIMMSFVWLTETITCSPSLTP